MKELVFVGAAVLTMASAADGIKTMTKNNAHAYGGYGQYGDYINAATRDNYAWVWDDGTQNTPSNMPTTDNLYVVESIGEFAQVGDEFEPALWLSNSVSGSSCRIRPRKEKWTFSDLHLFPKTAVISLGGNWNEIAGNVTLHGTEDKPVEFQPGGGQMSQHLSANLHGDGLVRFLSTEYAYPNNAITNRLTGVATTYSGAVDVTTTGFTYDFATGQYGYRDESKRNWMTLWIDGEDNLGVAPSTFAYNQLRLRNGGPLYVADNVAIDDANRGIYVEGVGIMSVAAGKTLSVGVPLTVNGTLVKQGSGTLAFGGAFRFGIYGDSPVQYRNRVRVESGRVKPLSGRAFNGAQFILKSDTAVEIDVSVAESDFRTYGLMLVKSESVAPFAQEGDEAVSFAVTGVDAYEISQPIPLVTVRSSFADTVRGKIAVTTDSAAADVSVVESNCLVDGVQATTFSARLLMSSGLFYGETVSVGIALGEGDVATAASPDHAVNFTALSVEGGAFGLTSVTASGAPGTAVLSGDSIVAVRPIRLTMDESMDRPAADTFWTVLRIDDSLGEFSDEDFVLDWPGNDRSGATGAYDAYVSVGHEGGEYVVKIGFKPIKTMTKNIGSSSSSAMTWDDGTVNSASNLPSDDYAYQVYDISQFKLFPGMHFTPQLSLFASANEGCRIFPASRTGTTLDDCHMYSGSGILAGGSQNALNEVCGKIALHGSSVTNPVFFTHGASYCNLDIKATLHGTGPLRVATYCVQTNYMPNGNYTTIQLSGDNRGWTGRLQVTCAGGNINFDNESWGSWSRYDTELKAYDPETGEFKHLYPCAKRDGTVLCNVNTNWVVFPLLDEKCIGGNPKELNRSQFLFGGACRMVVTNDVSISAPNRGITFECSPHIVVSEGATLTLRSPLSLAGTLWKDGVGDLCLASSAETMFSKERSEAGSVPVNRYNRLRIEEGALAIQSGKVLDGVSLRLSAGTKIKIDWADADENLKTYGIYNVKLQDNSGYIPFEWLDGVGLPVDVRYSGVTSEVGERAYKIPLATVRSTVAAAVASRLSVDFRIKGYEASTVQSETFTEGGVELTRFYVTGISRRGLLLFVR